MRALAVQLGVAAIALAWLCPGAGAQGDLAALQGDLSHVLSVAGSGSSGYVYDLSSRQALFSARATVLRPPASIQKLYTATAVLQLLGPDARLTTSVLGGGYLDPSGTWQGNLSLRGGGDPTSGSSAFIRRHYAGLGASVSTLAARLVGAAGLRAVAGSIEGDETYLNGLRGEPSSGFAPDPFLEGLLSGLAFNRGEGGLAHRSHAPAAYAARQLLAALKARGVRVSGPAGAASTPPAVTPLAQVQSPTIAQLLGLMLPASDNFFAETLLKDLGRGALPGKDGHPHRRLQPRRLLPITGRAHARVRLLQRRPACGDRPRAAGPHGDHAGRLASVIGRSRGRRGSARAPHRAARRALSPAPPYCGLSPASSARNPSSSSTLTPRSSA